jgi:exopolysaccharide production protein ExoQ
MPQQLATFICILLILFLFAKEGRVRPLPSWESWIPLLWIVILGTRPVSYWFGTGTEQRELENYLEGSPLDAAILFILIVMGLYILWRRNIDWGEFTASNRCFLAFLFYCGMSVIWSDYTFTSFKRYFKEIGNVIMVMIIVTEEEPAEATRALFARYAYIAIPLSVLFIKYYPDIGRYYNRWTWEPGYSGIATWKNSLGVIAMLSGLFLISDFVDRISGGIRKADKIALLFSVAMILMVIWLLAMAQSSTSLVCFILGTGIFLLLRLPSVKMQVNYLGAYSIVGGLLCLIVYFYEDIFGAIVGAVGRDMTMTGRSYIWTNLLESGTNPLLGSGFDSYWLSHYGQSNKWGFYYLLNQAHNGYLETYLQLGLIGLCLLLAVIVATGIQLKRDILDERPHGEFFLSLFIVILVYNWTEAAFNKLSLIWLVFIICAIHVPHLPSPVAESTAQQDLDTA